MTPRLHTFIPRCVGCMEAKVAVRESTTCWCCPESNRRCVSSRDWQRCNDSCCLFTSSVESERNTSCTMMPDCTAATPAVTSPPLWTQKVTLHALWCLTALQRLLLSLHLLCGVRKKHFMHYDAWLHCGNSCCHFTSSVESERNASCTVSSPPLWTQKVTLQALSPYLLCGFRKKHFMHYDAWRHGGNSCCHFTSSVDSESNTSCTMMPDGTAATPAVTSPPLWTQKVTLHALWCLTALRQLLLSLHLLCGLRK